MRPMLILSLAALCCLLGGCVKTVYLDQETPAGMVPRATAAPAPSLEEGLQQGYQAVASASAENTSALTASFRVAYDKARQPRIAVYLNRALSEEVREWKADERIVAGGRIRGQEVYQGTVGNESSPREVIYIADGDEATKKRLEGRLAADVEYSVSRQDLVEDSARTPLTETWGWAFEDGFSKPFLEAGTRLVDRATTMRLTASEMMRKGDLQPQLSVRQVEIEALKGYADLLVEILVTKSHSDAAEYDFKVSVKDVQTGLLLANATSLYPGSGLIRGNSYKATAQGFQEQGDDPYQTGRQLGLEVMDELVAAWTR